MRLVKFTDLHERDVWVNPDRVDGLYPSGDSATGITASGSEDNLLVRGKPAEVAARLAGESPQVDDPEMVPMSIFQATQQKLAAAEEGRAEVESHLQDAADALTAAEARASVTEQQRDQARAERDNFARRVNSLTDEVDGLRSEILRLSTSAFTNEEQHERDLAALAAERDALKAERDVLRAAVDALGINDAGWPDDDTTPEPQPEEPAEEAGEDVVTDAPIPDVTSPAPDIVTGGGSTDVVTPAPATPPTATGALDVDTAFSTSGIIPDFPLGTAKVLRLTRNSDGSNHRGGLFVLYVADDFQFTIEPDNIATDGPAKGTIRYRTNNGGDPFYEGRGSSAAATLFKGGKVHVPASLWPAANGPITMAMLDAMQPPLIDADGSKWHRVEAWSDDFAHGANKSEAATRATVFYVVRLAEGAQPVRPPHPDAKGYHASEPITVGNPVVHPITFTTDADPSPSEGEVSADLFDPNVVRDPTLDAIVSRLVTDGFQSKRTGDYLIDRQAGHHITLRNQSGTGEGKHAPQYSALLSAVRLRDGTASPEDKEWCRWFGLNNGLSSPEIDLACHGDRTRLWAAFSYDPYEEVFCVAFTYAEGKKHGLWTPSEEARIRDQLARFVWTSLQLHRNPYHKWINPNGATQAMWESARDYVCGLISVVVRHYQTPQYGGTLSWGSYFIDGAVWVFSSGEETVTRSGLFGMLDANGWNDLGGRYFNAANMAGILALTLNSLKCAGETVPDYYEQAFIDALTGKLKGAENVKFLALVMVNSNWPRYRAAVQAIYTKAELLKAATQPSHSDPPHTGMGAGMAALSMLTMEVV